MVDDKKETLYLRRQDVTLKKSLNQPNKQEQNGTGKNSKLKKENPDNELPKPTMYPSNSN